MGIKDKIKFIGNFLSFGMMIVMSHTFLVAYLHPSKTVLVNIDKFGEANFEIILIAVLVCLGITAMIFNYKDLEIKWEKH